MVFEGFDLSQMMWMGNSVLSWILAGTAALAVVLVLPIVKSIGLSYASKHVADEKVSVWAILAKCLSKTYFPVILIFAIYAASRFIVMPPNLQKFIGVVVILAVFLQVAIWVNSIVDLYSTNYQRRLQEVEGEASTALSLISFFAKVVLIAIFLLVALDQLGVNVTTLIAGLGVGGIAIALAAQTILSDLFASLTIVLDKPFKVTDFLVIGDFAGSVERVGLKTTRIRSISGEQLIFSNNDLLQSRIRNFKRMQERRIVFKFGILYETPLEKTRQVAGWVKEIIESLPEARFDRSHFFSFGNFSLDFEVVYFVLGPEYNKYMDLQQEINLRLFAKLEAEGVEFAYPTQKLFVENHMLEDEKNDQDRASENRSPQL